MKDSIDKIVKTYFAAVTREPFTYKGATYNPKPLQVSPLLLRGFTCPAGCGACCLAYTLDYLPEEVRPATATLVRKIKFNDGVEVYSDMNPGQADNRCQHLRLEDGRCGIYPQRAFSCDFELIRFFNSALSSRLTQQLYGRGWNMRRVDGGRGARCEMLPVTDESQADVLRKLARLKQWVEHFGIKRHCVGAVIDWSEEVRPTPLEVAADQVAYTRSGFFGL